MSDVEIKEHPSSPETETSDPLYAHIIKRNDLMTGLIFGQEVEALCGKRWVPSREGTGLPVCQMCLDLNDAVDSDLHVGG